jgi:hypothetical protein
MPQMATYAGEALTDQPGSPVPWEMMNQGERTTKSEPSEVQDAGNRTLGTGRWEHAYIIKVLKNLRGREMGGRLGDDGDGQTADSQTMEGN